MKNLYRLLLFITIATFSINISAQELVSSLDTTLMDVEKLIVKADFCVVRLIGSSEAVLKIEGRIKANKTAVGYNMSIVSQDDAIVISVNKPANWNSHWGEIVLSIPSGLSVDVESLSGKIDAEGLTDANIVFNSKSGHASFTDVSGVFLTNTANGDIIFRQSAGNIKGVTKTGNLYIDNFQGSANVTADKGSVSVKNVEGDLVIYGGEGKQEFDNVNGNLRTKSTSGDVNISLCKGNINCRTFSASQKIFQSEGKFEIQSSKGNIVGNRIKFSESSSFLATEGGIKVQTNTKTNIRYELSSNGSILRALNKSKKKSLKIGKGDILITGVTTTGAQSYY